MSILEQIRADQLTARKAKDALSASLLTTLIGEATKITDEDFKKGQTAVTDEKVIATLKKFLKNAQDTKLALGDDPRAETTEREIALLNNYLPQQMSEADLAKVIAEFRAATPDANMGSIMAHLKANYAGLYDGKVASQLAKG
jgi:uncharacterized protein YqeY